MLNGNLALGDVQDVEAFCRALLNEQLAVGSRRADGSFTGPMELSPTLYDEALAFLVATTWELHERYDGRGTFSGHCTVFLHRRFVDWVRREFGSTRYGPRPVVELTDDERIHVAEQTDLTGPEVLELVHSVELSVPARQTLERIVVPLVREQRSVKDYSEQSGVPMSQIERALGRLRRELERTKLLAA